MQLRFKQWLGYAVLVGFVALQVVSLGHMARHGLAEHEGHALDLAAAPEVMMPRLLFQKLKPAAYVPPAFAPLPAGRTRKLSAI